MRVERIATHALGDRSYLVYDGAVAVVVDPQRDIDRVERVAERAGVRITHVAETHIHNDYLTGGYHLADKHGAEYLVHAADEVTFRRRPVQAGEDVAVGELTVVPVTTPGHTENHLAYVVRHGSRPDAEQAVFSGGNLLYGSVGRTDLVAPERTRELRR